MAKSKKAAKADTKAPEADNTPEQERPGATVKTRTDVENPNDAAAEAADPYARKPKTETRKVDGRATLKTRI